MILGLVVDAYLVSGRPVASKPIAELDQIEWGPSTVRAELAELEAAVYLTHPHTSAGRVPTDSGYRHYVDSLMKSDAPSAGAAADLRLTQLRREINEALRETTAALADVTDLMALVTASGVPAGTTLYPTPNPEETGPGPPASVTGPAPIDAAA